MASAKLLATTFIAIVFILSFRAFSAVLTPALNSDNAIHILMAYDFRFPEDLYYWGQDRLGSLIPLLSHLLLKVLPVSPALAVSFVQYFLLFLGFLCLTSLLQKTISKVIFALIWFLPLEDFDVLARIGQPYGAQFASIGVAAFLTNQLLQYPAQNQRKRQALITGATISLFISLWVSDLSVIILFLFLIFLIGLCYFNRLFLLHPNPVNSLVNPPVNLNVDLTTAASSQPAKYSVARLDLLNILVTSIAGILFVLYAKQNASPSSDRYGLLSTPEQILTVIQRLFSQYAELLSPNSDNFFLSLHAILVLILAGYFFYLFWVKKINIRSMAARNTVSLWFYFFLSSSILGLILLVSLQWIYITDGLRYYTFVYVSLWLAALLLAESFDQTTAQRTYCILVLMALCSSLSQPAYTYRLVPIQPTLQKLAEIQTLGQAGLIGNHWTSYLSCSVNPALLNCTRYDKKGSTKRCLPPGRKQRRVGKVRCRRCVTKVLESDSIYLIKNRWLKQFPQETQQFGQCLIKVGEPQKIGPYTMARYRKRVE